MMKMNKEEFEKARKLLLKNAEKLMQVKAPEPKEGFAVESENQR